MTAAIKNSFFIAAVTALIVLASMSQAHAISGKDDVLSSPDGYTESYEYVELFNGDTKYLKLQIQEPIVNNYVMKGSDRLSRVSFLNPTKILFDGDNGWGTDGYEDGDIHVKVYYDFNKDGDWADSGEYIGTMTHHINKRQIRLNALSMAQAAVSYYGTNNYDADMLAIRAYLYKNYPYKDCKCGYGDRVCQVWSAKKYRVYGYIDCPNPSVNPDHEAFYPENNPYSQRLYWEAQGYKGSAPDANTLKYYEDAIDDYR